MGTNSIGLAARSFLIVGLFEETAKVLGLFAVYPFIKKRLTGPAAAIIYMSCVALGFSLIENYSYAGAGPSGSLFADV
jgi:RsiW-degrading membrane proteinase PrsW (M82 family)